MTDNVAKNIHNYNLDNIIINLDLFKNSITKEQKCLILNKYRDQIGKNIKLSIDSIESFGPIKKDDLNELTI